MVKIGEPWDFHGNNNSFDYYYLCHIQFSSNSNAMKKKKLRAAWWNEMVMSIAWNLNVGQILCL